jgi:membrane protease YdiL (CAAX protease family)
MALGVRVLSFFAPFLPAPPVLVRPSGLGGWLVLGVFCLGTGYLEEGYFRVYLETRLSAGGLTPLPRLAIACGLFTLCHLYQGPVGLCNAALAGLFLLLVYRKTGTLHGLALGHGCYNILVYAFGA